MIRFDHSFRNGLFTKDWNEHFGKRYKLPWDEEAYDKAIDILSDKIKIFVNNNQKNGRQFISFVGDDNTIGTHQDMINRSGVIPKENQFLKRAEAREEPYEYVKNKIADIFSKIETLKFIESKHINHTAQKNIKFKI